MEFMRFPDIKSRPPPVLLRDDIGPAAEITSESEVNMAFPKWPAIIPMMDGDFNFNSGIIGRVQYATAKSRPEELDKK